MINHDNIPLDSSPNGLPVVVTATTASTAQLVHTAGSSGSGFLTLWVNNDHSADVEVRVFVVNNGDSVTGSTPVASSIIVPSKSGKAVCEPGILIKSSVKVHIMASVANVITYQGYEYRRTSV